MTTAGQHDPIDAAAEAQRESQSAVRDVTRLTRLFTLLSEPAPLAVLLDRVVLALSEMFSADLVTILQADPPGALSALAAIGVPERMAHRPFSGAEGSCAAAAVKQRRPVLVVGAQLDDRVDSLLRELCVESAAWLPILGSREVLGVLLLANCHPLPLSRPDVDLLMAMGHRIGLVLERARAEEERQALEARLRQAEKAESLGRMAGAIAHQFNNGFSVIMGNLGLALQDLPPDHQVRGELVEALEATRQASKLSGLMLAYLGQGQRILEPLDLVGEFQAALLALADALPERVRLRAELGEGPLAVRGHAASLRRVLEALVTNAWEALSERGGEVVVSLGVVPAGRVASSPFASPGWTPGATDYACLEVSDDGAGMDAATLQNVFDPFFTTKFAGRGLGLPVVLGTVRAHDGTVAVQSEVGRGTTVRVYLPRWSQAPTPAQPGVPRGPAAGPGHGLVLVADDEPMLRRSTGRLLARMGYQVITASDGVEAVEAFRRHQAEVQLVLLDLTMPRLGGWETLAALRALEPGVPAILASGYEEAQVMGGQRPEQWVTFLQKPFEWAELQGALERVLEAAQARGWRARPRP
jgi:signal transduction histidine kinase/ActR/RegA family two-component response regulator